MVSSTLGKEQCADQEKKVVKGPVKMISFGGFGESPLSKRVLESDPVMPNRKEAASLGDMGHGFIFYVDSKEASTIPINYKANGQIVAQKWERALMKHNKFLL